MIPQIMHQVEGEWKVDPAPLIAIRESARKVRDRER